MYPESWLSACASPPEPEFPRSQSLVAREGRAQAGSARWLRLRWIRFWVDVQFPLNQSRRPFQTCLHRAERLQLVPPVTAQPRQASLGV